MLLLFSEPCHNPEQYIDYDICETVTPENCLTEDVDERKMLEEFCPEQCVCSMYRFQYRQIKMPYSDRINISRE